MAEYEVRSARTGEGRAVAELKRRSWQAAYAGLLPDDLLADLPLHPPPGFYDDEVAAGRAPVVAVAPDGAIVAVGAVGTARDPDLPPTTGELVMIYAAPSVWGVGVGHRVHEQCLARLAAAGHAEAVLWVLEGNTRARRFYEAHGWRPDGATRSDEHGGRTVVVRRHRRAVGGTGLRS